jgi:F-type H+-transporting ATPase subunit b
MSPFSPHFAVDASGPAALGINGQAFVIQLVTFLVVFLILRHWAFKPILKMLNERRDLIEEGVTLGEKMRIEEAKLQAAVAAKLQNARKQGDVIIADAEVEARQKIQQSETVAQQRADGIITDAEERIAHASKRERARLVTEVFQLVSEVSEAVIKEKVDATKDAVLINNALNERRSA